MVTNVYHMTSNYSRLMIFSVDERIKTISGILTITEKEGKESI
jgi:hypothetical protein